MRAEMARNCMWAVPGCALLVALLAGPVAAQEGTAAPGRPLTLEEALRLAAGESEEIAIAQAGLTRAQGTVQRANSARLPQLNGSASYSRALASQFQA
jgi:outer membrane protein TolC